MEQSKKPARRPSPIRRAPAPMFYEQTQQHLPPPPGHRPSGPRPGPEPELGPGLGGKRDGGVVLSSSLPGMDVLPRPPGFSEKSHAGLAVAVAAGEEQEGAAAARPEVDGRDDAPPHLPHPEGATEFDVFRPRYTSFKPDPSRERPSLDEVLALCLAKTPSELTATEIETLEVVPSLRGKFAESIRAEDIVTLKDARETEAARELTQKTMRLKEIRAKIRRDRAELKTRFSESERVIKRMFYRFKEEGKEKTIATLSVSGASGEKYEHVISCVPSSSSSSLAMDVVDDDADEEEEEEEEEEGRAGGEGRAKADVSQPNGFIKTPPSGAFSHIIHRSVVAALHKLGLSEYVGREMSPTEAKVAVWKMMNNPDFIREFMVSCVSLSRIYNEEKKKFHAQKGSEKTKDDVVDQVRIKVEKRALGPPSIMSSRSGGGSRLSSIIARRAATQASRITSSTSSPLPRPPGTHTQA